MRKVSRSLAGLLVSFVFVFAGGACSSDKKPPSTAATAADSAAAKPDEPPLPDAPPVRAPPGWLRYVSRAGNFSVFLPGHPKETTRGDDGKGPLVQAEYDDPETGISYGISYDDIDPTFIGHPDELFGKVRDGFVHDREAPGDLVDDEPATLLGVPGRELRFAAAADIVLSLRLYILRDHVWTVMVSSPKDRFSETGTRAFLDTFRLTSSP